MTEVTYERPVPATLIVRLENGEEFAAKPEDLAKFGYIDKNRLLEDVRGFIKVATQHEVTNTAFAPLWNVLAIAALNRDNLHGPETQHLKDELCHLDSRIRGTRPDEREF